MLTLFFCDTEFSSMYPPSSPYAFGRMGGAPWGVAVYIIVLALITAGSIWFGPETFTSDLQAEEEPARALGAVAPAE